ncbi:MAG TPA: cytidine deaminase [Ohtaekwangia sp.]|nr:cytidine deaminase [Ohtaekwangia sp.]
MVQLMKDFTLLRTLEALDTESKYLVHKAKEATHHAYAPYSRFHVGAAVLLEDGTVVTGANQENAAYPSGMCAERVALFSAVAQHPDMVILKIAVVAKKKNAKELTPCTSCGPCRQVMLEIETRQHRKMAVIMHTDEHQWVEAASAAALLPFAFTKSNLKK